MIDIKISENEVDDIRDDILENYDSDLYNFINGDVVRAFWAAYLISEMVDNAELDTEQYLLYSRQLRHAEDVYSEYLDQLVFWGDKCEELNNKPKTTEFINYILNNIVCLKDSDLITLAIQIGINFYEESHKEHGNTNSK